MVKGLQAKKGRGSNFRTIKSLTPKSSSIFASLGVRTNLVNQGNIFYSLNLYRLPVPGGGSLAAQKGTGWGGVCVCGGRVLLSGPGGLSDPPPPLATGLL